MPRYKGAGGGGGGGADPTNLAGWATPALWGAAPVTVAGAYILPSAGNGFVDTFNFTGLTVAKAYVTCSANYPGLSLDWQPTIYPALVPNAWNEIPGWAGAASGRLAVSGISGSNSVTLIVVLA